MDWCQLRPGHREQHDLVESEKKIHHCTQHGLFPIPQLFRALSTDSGEYLWAATALLVHSVNTHAGIQMMNAHTQHPSTFQWLSLYSSKTSRRKRKHNVSKDEKKSVSQLVQDCSPYQIMKISSKNNNK
eukprot:scaffold87706_cov72-Attheya_sp.AAC.4